MRSNLKHRTAALGGTRILLFAELADVSRSKLGDLGEPGGKVGVTWLRKKSRGDGRPSGHVPRFRRHLV